MILDLYQSLQKNKVLLALLDSENKQTRLNDAFKEIGTCSKAIKIRIIAKKEFLAQDKSLFFEVNLLRGV